MKRIRESFFGSSILKKNILSKFFLLAFSCLILWGPSCSSTSQDELNNNVQNGGPAQPDEKDDPTDGGNPVPRTDLKITTFNLGLFPFFVPLTDERLGPLQQALQAHDSDILCLQEIYEAGDLNAIKDAIEGIYPYINSPPPRQRLATQLPVCTQEDLNPLITCMNAFCLIAGDNFLACLKESCLDEAEELAATNRECAEAVSAEAGKPLWQIVLDIPLILLNDQSRAPLFAFEGRTGLLLASKFPLENLQVLDLSDSSTTTNHAGVFATVEVEGRDYTIGCTHLTANLDGALPYVGPFTSWEEEAGAQAEEIVDFSASYGGEAPQYLAGDFNCSLANVANGVNGEFEGVCQEFLDAGYEDVAGDQLGCSFCEDNLINQMNPLLVGGLDVLLDHIFFGAPILPDLQTEIVLNQEIMIDSDPAHLSDHFGVRMTTPLSP